MTTNVDEAAKLFEAVTNHINGLIDAATGSPDLFAVIKKYQPYLMACMNKNYDAVITFAFAHGLREEVVMTEAQITAANYMCHRCGCHDVTYDVITADMTCHHCGNCCYNSDIGYLYSKQTVEEMDHYTAYKKVIYSRITNMKTILRNMQSYPSPLVPATLEFVGKYKGSVLSFQELRQLMKKHRLSHSYSKTHLIMSMVNPQYKCLKLTRAQHMLILCKFKDILQVFTHENQFKRSNFLNYHYVIKCICIEYQLYHVLPHLFNLKCIVTVQKHTEIMEAIKLKLVYLSMAFMNVSCSTSLG